MWTLREAHLACVMYEEVEKEYKVDGMQKGIGMERTLMRGKERSKNFMNPTI